MVLQPGSAVECRVCAAVSESSAFYPPTLSTVLHRGHRTGAGVAVRPLLPGSSWASERCDVCRGVVGGGTASPHFFRQGRRVFHPSPLFGLKFVQKLGPSPLLQLATY